MARESSETVMSGTASDGGTRGDEGRSSGDAGPRLVRDDTMRGGAQTHALTDVRGPTHSSPAAVPAGSPATSPLRESDDEDAYEDASDDEGFIRGHVHVLQLVTDEEVIAGLLEDKEALRIASAHMQSAYGSSIYQNFEELCRRGGQMMRMLTAYFERVRLDARMGRLDGEAEGEAEGEGEGEHRAACAAMEPLVRQLVQSHQYGAMEAQVRLFEVDVVHHCMCTLLPNVLGLVMRHACRMPVGGMGAMAGLLVQWARLCGEMLSARMMQMSETGRCFALRYEVTNCSSEETSDMCGGRERPGGCAVEEQGRGGRTYASHLAFVEQVRLSFDVLTKAVKLVSVMLGEANDPSISRDGWENGDRLKLVVFEMERLEPTRLTGWVDVDARRMPADQELWGRFHGAILVDVFGRMECVMEAIRISESLAVDMALLEFVKEVFPILAEDKRCTVVETVVEAKCGRYGSAFGDGDCHGSDRSPSGRQEKSRKPSNSEFVFGGFADLVGVSTSNYGSLGHAVVSLLLPALRSMFHIVAHERAASGDSATTTSVASAVASLEERLVWALFLSKNVSEQLLAITSLIEILEDVDQVRGRNTGGIVDDRELDLVRISWVPSTNILREMLKVNLHHAQYVEDMLQLLRALSSHDLVDARHVTQLWSMLQDEGTFEEIKSNACQLLGFLSTALYSAENAEWFCQMLQGNGIPQMVEGKYIEEMMLASAKYDTSCRLIVRLVDISLGFCLSGSDRDPLPVNRTERMLSGDLLLDISRKYLAHCRASNNNSPFVDCISSVIGACMQRIGVGVGQEAGQVFQDPDASDLLQPLRLLLRIFSSNKIPYEALNAVYKVVNDNAKLMGDIMAGYEENLVRMSHSSHADELLRVFNAILRSVLSESNYYLEFGKVRKILGWATAVNVSAESSTYAWSLLTYLVQEEKGIVSKTARLFLAEFMENVRYLTAESWLCFTAYLAAWLDFESSLSIADSYADLIKMTDENYTLDVWEPLKDFLCASLLDCCETDAIAAQCSSLLSHVLIADMDMNISAADPHRVKAIIESFKNKILDKPARVMMFLGDVLDAYDFRECDEFQLSPAPGIHGNAPVAEENKETGYETIVTNSARNRSRSARPLYSCFKEEDMSFKVILKNLPMSPRPSGVSGNHPSVEISCPRNCMIADLRAIISEQASHLVGYLIPHPNFNLQNKGRTLTSNFTRVCDCIGDGVEVLAVFNTKASFRAPPMPEFQLSHMLAQDQGFFRSLMALGDSGSHAALALMKRLPISEGMVRVIEHNCGNGDQQDLGVSVMLYACLLMETRISPMSVDGIPFCRVEAPLVHVPAPQLLQIMSRLYATLGKSVGGDLPRLIVQLMSWIVDQQEIYDNVDDSDKDDCCLVALMLMHEVVADSISHQANEASTMAPKSSLSVDDVRFVISGAMKAVLMLNKKRGFIPEVALRLFIADVKDVLRHDDPHVRKVGVRTAQTLFQEHDGIEKVLLRDLISDILLREPSQSMSSWAEASMVPAPEPLLLCSWLIDRIDSSHNSTVLEIAETICKQIMVCLKERKTIDGESKCLQIALQRVNAGDLPSIHFLVSEILDTFLLPNLLGSLGNLTTDSSALPVSYSAFFETSKYALDQQDGLYRILLASSMLSDESWETLNAKLRCFFREISFPGLYNNSALCSFRNLNNYCGLLNGGATCYMNATFQQLYMMPRLRRLLLAAPFEEDPEKSSPVLEALRTIFLGLFGGVDEVVDPSCFWKEFKDYDGNPVDVREHQDGYEFFTRLQDAVDEHLKGRGCEKIMRLVLGGSFNQIIEVPDHEGVKSEREEEFYQISIDVRGKKDLIESLDSYVAPETLDGQNQWFCESLGRKVDAKKRTLIKKLPESLVFHLKRFEWDYETYQRWKIKDRFEFPTELDMAPYLEGSRAECDITGSDGRQLYDLSGVIVHSGTAFAGHYYSFAKERETGKWYHFDDDSVIEWNIADIDEECFGGEFQPSSGGKMYMRSQSAYMVIYDRRLLQADPTAKASTPTEASDFDAICATIPPNRLQDLLQANGSEISKSFAFSQSLSKAMATVSREVKSAVRGPQSSRKLKTDALCNERSTEIPLHNEVFHIPRGQDRDGRGVEAAREIPLAINQAVTLGLEYVSRIAVCGPFGREPAIEILQPLLPAVEEPLTARYVLAQSSTVDAVLAAMASPYRATRSILREFMAICVQTAIDTKECSGFLQKILKCIQSALETPSLVITWRDLLGLLVDVSQSSKCTKVLSDYTSVLLSFSETMYELWRQQTKQERATEAGILTSYAAMVCNLLRHHRLSNDGARDVQGGNPFCIARDRQLALEPSSEAIRSLVSIGMDNDGLLLFLHFWSWESRTRSASCVKALIECLRSNSHQLQVPLTVDFLRLEDSTAASRTREFIHGALDLYDEFRGNGWGAYNVSLAIASVLTSSSVEDLKVDLLPWAQSAAETCASLAKRISSDEKYREQWIRGIPTCSDTLNRLYDPVELLAVIKSLVDGQVVVDIEPEIDLVRASESSDEKENDDGVKEIVIEGFSS